MSNIDIYTVKSDEVYRLVRSRIEGCIDGGGLIENEFYHCNAKFSDIPSILELGLLSKRLKKMRFFEKERDAFVRKHLRFTNSNIELYLKLLRDNNYGRLTKEEERIANLHYTNGADMVSVSTMNPELPFSRMYKDEFIYNPYDGCNADIVINKGIDVFTTITSNYFNEVLVNNSISQEFFTGINVRVLRAIDKIEKDDSKDLFTKSLEELEIYNNLRDIVLALKEFNTGKKPIPLIEDSSRLILSDDDLVKGRKHSNDGCYLLDVEKISKLPKIYVK